MGFIKAVRICLRKYATFSGRASRSEYWKFVLFYLIGGLVVAIIDVTLFGTVTTTDTGASLESDGRIVTAYWALLFLPLFSAGWRRMHDTGRSGLYLVYPLIIMVGISTFVGWSAGFSTVLSGDFRTAFAALSDITAAVASAFMIVSPLLVLWWLIRPSEAGANEFGVPPGTGHVVE